jgi:hypothetical protein
MSAGRSTGAGGTPRQGHQHRACCRQDRGVATTHAARDPEMRNQLLQVGDRAIRSQPDARGMRHSQLIGKMDQGRVDLELYEGRARRRAAVGGLAAVQHYGRQTHRGRSSGDQRARYATADNHDIGTRWSTQRPAGHGWLRVVLPHGDTRAQIANLSYRARQSDPLSWSSPSARRTRRRHGRPNGWR